MWVGLRPGRTPLRLEMEMYQFQLEENENSISNPPHQQIPVFHCYGHGGSGVTLAMGCANDLILNHLLPYLRKQN